MIGDSYKLTILDWFLYFWLAISAIKFVIVFGTMLITILKYRNTGINVRMLLYIFSVCVVIGGFSVIIWPVALLKEKSDFLNFPSKVAEEAMINYMESMDL